jgi:transposase
MTIPGVGVATAVAVSCWIGDIRRFPSAKKLVSYFGIAPKVRQSANRETHGHISKEGSGMVRWLILQAALVGIRMSKGPARGQYLGVSRRRGKKIARIAERKIDKKVQLFRGQLAFSSTMEGVCSAQVQAQNKHSRGLKA